MDFNLHVKGVGVHMLPLPTLYGTAVYMLLDQCMMLTIWVIILLLPTLPALLTAC